MKKKPEHIILIILFAICYFSSFSQNNNNIKAISNNTIDKYKIYCGTSNPLPILGSKPLGVDSTVQFRWIKTQDTLINVSWVLTSPADTFQNYLPPNPGSMPMFYKRIVFWQGVHDSSNTCVVKVVPNSTDFSSNFISPGLQNIYIGDIPSAFIGTVISGGTTTDTIKYVWLKSTDAAFSITYPALEGTYNAKDFFFNEPADTSFYFNRFAYLLLPSQELACVLYSNTVMLKLLDSNYISCADTALCEGEMSQPITGTMSATYVYQWQVLNNSTSIWENIPGENGPNYLPGSLITSTKYRRIVIVNGNITLISNVISINVTPQITNNTIWNSSGVICSGQSGANILGNNLSGGNGSYIYKWYYSTDSINWIMYTGPFATINYFPSQALYGKTFFLRGIQSGACIDTSNIVVVIPIVVEATAQTPILACGNVAILNAVPPTSGNSGWSGPPEVIFADPTVSNTSATIAIFTTPNITYNVKWFVNNSGCTDTANVSITYFHDTPPAYAGTDITLVDNDSVRLNAQPPQYGTGIWSIVLGGGNFYYINDAQSIVTNIPFGENVYRWTISNGPCPEKYDDVIITVTNVKIPEGFSPNSDLVNDNFEIHGLEFYPKAELVVFNRWGIEVYRKKSYDNSWLGKSNNGNVLPEDTYFYILKLDDKSSLKGFVILKR